LSSSASRPGYGNEIRALPAIFDDFIGYAFLRKLEMALWLIIWRVYYWIFYDDLFQSLSFLCQLQNPSTKK